MHGKATCRKIQLHVQGHGELIVMKGACATHRQNKLCPPLSVKGASATRHDTTLHERR